jgi:deoxyribodipyrimidine photolyase-related protein
MERRSETDYAPHHIQKVVAFFSAMRSFSEWLKSEGHQVRYIRLDDAENRQSFTANLKELAKELEADKIEIQQPDEFRLDQEFNALSEELEVDVEIVDSEHFLSQRMDLRDFFQGKKQWLMESFYRQMRRKYEIMMEPNGKDPVTGRWNYDAENRKKLPRDIDMIEPKSFKRDVSELVKMIREAGVETIGRIDPQNFIWPVCREESLELLDFFISDCLPQFGKYQDAMDTDYWSLYHSRLSFSLNTKMLHPLEVVDAAVKAWENGEADIAQVEGFVRQIIGWREYMRGVYWAKMPEYAKLNYFDHKRRLPGFFWTGETKMNCLKHAINQSLDYAYAHHIQRLMVTGNFALLAGIDPNEVDAWYLGIYIDALEWVEITNTRGMSQFADGGIVGTKPYVSSANYIHKMSNYCDGCAYNRSEKTGEMSCPFNSLYWHFYHRNEDKLARNPRVGMMYRTWSKMKDKDSILEQAEYYLENLETL